MPVKQAGQKHSTGERTAVRELIVRGAISAGHICLFKQ